jgi:hypothetical protein
MLKWLSGLGTGRPVTARLLNPTNACAVKNINRGYENGPFTFYQSIGELKGMKSLIKWQRKDLSWYVASRT